MKKIIQLVVLAFVMSTTVSAQIGGNALELDGANDYVNCGNGSNFNITGTAITIEAWIYTKNINQNWQAIAGKQTHASGVFTLIIDSDTKKPALWLKLGSLWNQRVIANTAIEQDKWYHIAGTYDGTTAKIYIDGKLDNSQACSGSIPDALSEPFYIGMNNNVYFNGKIDEVRLWNTTRTEAEIKANMYKEISTHTNLKAYYKMSDGSGTTLTDNSGNNNTGTLTNGPIWKMSGAFAGPRQALDFERTKLQSVNFGTPSAFQNLGNGSYTIEAWVKSSYTGRQAIFGNWSNSYGATVLEIYSSGQLRTYVNSTGYNSTKVVTDGKWHHVVAVRDINAGIVKMYVDGNLIFNQSGCGTTGFTGPAGIRYALGANLDGSGYELYFEGNMDEVRIWNTARTELQIRENMMRNLIGNESNLVAYYRMDQKDGTTLYDQTANAANGTLTNMDAATDWVASSAFNTWLGGESSAWSTAANWSAGVAPSTTDNVGVYKWTEGNELNVSSTVNTGSMIISANSNPTIDAAINTTGAIIPLRNVNLKFTTNNSIGSVTNPSNNELIIPADAKVTVSTDILNEGKIILKSTDSNSAQLKNTGSTTTPGTVILRKDLKATSGWYFVSFPFDVTFANIKKTSTQTAVTIGDFKTATGPAYDDLYIIEYNGARRDQTGTTTVTNSPNWDAVTTGPLLAKRGYAILVKNDIEIDFIGTTNSDMFANADKTASVINNHTNASSIHHGWNLVGIPYTTAFDIANINQGTYYYVYNRATQTYNIKQKSVDTYQIDPFSSFFMQAGSTSLTFANAGRALKAPSAVNVADYSEIDLSLQNSSFSDRTQIRFSPTAMYDYELNVDAAKLLSLNNAVPQLWSKAQTFDVAINALPATATEVPLGIRIGTTGDYSIKLNNVTQNQTVILVDNANGNRINLNEQNSYTFNTTVTGTITDRFKIVTIPDVRTIIPKKNNVAIKITSLKGGFTVTGLIGNATVKLFDMTGKTIAIYNNVQNNSFYKSDYKGAVIYNVTDNLNN